MTHSIYMKSLLLSAALCLAAAPAAAQDGPPLPSDTVFELSQVEPMPRPTNVEEFHAALESGYPPALLGSGAEGTVVLSFVVAADGAVRDARVLQSTVEGFDSATVQAVSRLRFTPGAVDGRPVAVRLELPVAWQAPVADSTTTGVAGVRAAYADTTLELRDVTEPPRIRNPRTLGRRMAELYPPEFFGTRRTGVVQVRFRVDRDGNVQDPVIVESSHPGFDRPSLLAVRSVRFRPARINGSPVAVWAHLPIHWTIDMDPRFTPDVKPRNSP